MTEPNDDETTTGERPLSAPEGSPLANLRKRREQKMAVLYTDLSVRGLEPLVVRYRPVTAAETNRANKRFEPDKSDDKEVKINALVLTWACLGVFDKPDVTEHVETDPDWPKFDQRLAGELGLTEQIDHPQAIDVVRGLYLTDGDVISTGIELSRWSGYTLDDVDRDLAGN